MSGMGYIFLALVILAIVAVLLRPGGDTSGKGASASLKSELPVEISRHDRFFPQIRQALSEADDAYLRQMAPPEVARRARQERREIARQYLRGVRKDFSDLEQMARSIAALSPVVSRQQESERAALSLKFHLMYALVWVRCSTGKTPLGQMQYLTELLGQLAARMDQAMAEINRISASPLSGSVNG